MSTKEDIIKVATRLFAKKGYEGMTMKEIAREVGIKAPSIYTFFKSKEDVFLHIYKETLSRHLQVATANARTFQHHSAKEQLEHLLHSVIDYQFKESVLMKSYLRLLLFPPPFVEKDLRAALLDIEKQEHGMLSAILKKGMQQGEIKQGDCSALATSMICMMDGIFWQMQRYDEASFRQRFDVIWSQFWQSIKTQ